MYLILRHINYKHLAEDSYTIVGDAKDIKSANRLINAYNEINKNENTTFSVLNYEPPLILKKEVA